MEPAYSETIFSAGEYEQDSSQAGGDDWQSVTTNSQMPEAYPRYQPPHKRPINLEMGDFTQVPLKEDLPGVDNHAFQKLVVHLSFALVKDLAMKLAKAFPGCYFSSKSHNNHDHPYAHAVTQVGTRFAQRFFQPGQWILDVYGSPKSCDAFNFSQRRANLPKVMQALVAKACPSDFIREINKWGPPVDEEGARYQTGHLKRQTDDYLGMFDCFQFIHTLYYISNQELTRLLHLPADAARGGANAIKKGVALIHTHTKDHGFLNNGEQEYWVLNGIVKQKNVKTNTSYVHPNVTPFWMQEEKYWVNENGVGFTWELHFVCEDTWIVEIAPYTQTAQDSDFENDWTEKFELGEFDKLEKTVKVRVTKPMTMLPTKNGKFIELHVTCMPLFDNLRRFAIGRSREGVAGLELMKELITRGRNLVHPSSLFPDQPAMDCPDGDLYDHCLSAFVTDLERESNMLGCLDGLQKLIYSHSVKVTGKRNMPSSLGSADLIGNLRLLAAVGSKGIRAARSKDPIDAALKGFENMSGL